MKRISSHRKKPYRTPAERAARDFYTNGRAYALAKEWTVEDELLKNLRIWLIGCCNGSRLQAAEILGVSRRALGYQIRDYERMGYDVPCARFGVWRSELPPEFWAALNDWVNFRKR